MAVRIIVDSTTDLMEHVKKRVKTVPLTLHFGEEEYLDGVTINHKEFYEKLVASDVLPTTSQANPDAFEKVYEEVTREGDDAVVITIASKLSGTCQSANIAAQDYENIFVVDSQTAAIGVGILAEYALQLVDDGMSAEEVAKQLEEVRENVCLVALLDTLEYLKRGGRISKTVAFAGGVLSIKPIVCIEDGEIKMLGKARGSKQGNALLTTEINKAGGIDYEKPILLGYTGISEELLQKYVEDSKLLWKENASELPLTCVGSVIGTHAGPGAVAVAFFRKKTPCTE